ncbi:MAG: hypothetical protein HY866_15365 [Chloroflexi bacterium]|nr:hypothetical protein [Chloroflexota bacterium]
MANNRPSNGLAESPAANGSLRLSSRPRGLWGQIGLLIFQPGYFFDTLRQLQEVRQWFWVALLVLGLTAFSTVRTRPPAASSDTPSAPDETMIPTDTGSEGGLDFGAPPPEAFLSSTATSTEETVSEKWQRGAIAASNIILVWLILVLLLSQTSLANGKMPNLGKNLQIVVWACLPLGLMAALQLIYHWGGGEIGKPGLSGLLPEWSGYKDLTEAQQKVLMSLATRFTLFEWWAVILVYVGARHSLDGKRWVVGYIIITWITLIVVLPVLSGSITLPETEPVISPLEEFPPQDIMPFEEGAPDGGSEDSAPPVQVKPGARKG